MRYVSVNRSQGNYFKISTAKDFGCLIRVARLKFSLIFWAGRCEG